MSAPIVLPGDVYDTLEFSALVYGGIGGGWFTDETGPLCVYGHVEEAERLIDWEGFSSAGDAWRAVNDAGLDSNLNDNAVGDDGRIPFAEWCRRLNVVRGA